LPTSRSFPGALRDAHVRPPHFSLPNQEWRRCKIVSIRNLRLPVHSLLPDQAGTLAIVPDDASKKSSASAPFGRIRKGMVFTAMQPSATRSFVAEFRRNDLESLAVGNSVVVYIASVRASAKVVSARAPDSPVHLSDHAEEAYGLENLEIEASELGQARVAGAVTAHTLLVTFSFNASKEFVTIGDQVLVMPGGGPGLFGGHERGEKGMAGLDGFVGQIMEVYS